MCRYLAIPPMNTLPNCVSYVTPYDVTFASLRAFNSSIMGITIGTDSGTVLGNKPMVANIDACTCFVAGSHWNFMYLTQVGHSASGKIFKTEITYFVMNT